MAGKMPAGAAGYPPPGPPPPYQPYPQAGTTVVVQGGATHTTVVQGAPPPTVVHQKPARGIIGSVMKEVNLLGNQIGREIDYMSNKINEAVYTSSTAPALSLFQTGNVIQLISRSSGKALEILSGPNGQLIVDGNGPVDPNAFHTTWTVVNEGNNQVRLHNSNNYLTVVNGHTVLINMPPGVMHGVETKWQLSLMQNFVLLESMKERGRHIGVLPNGQLKPALACGREIHAQFGVQLLSSPYPHPQGVTVQTTTVIKK